MVSEMQVDTSGRGDWQTIGTVSRRLSWLWFDLCVRARVWKCTVKRRIRRPWRRWVYRPWHCLFRAHIHHVDDGRAPRAVYVNGTERKCYWCDTRRGIAECYVEPLQENATRDGVLKETAYGEVRVVFDPKP